MKKTKIIPPTLITKRLLIRPHRPSDEVLLNKAILDSFEELHPWMDWADKPQSLEETRAYIAYSEKCWTEEYPQELPLLILDLEEKNIIGSSGYNAIKWQIPLLEIGYWGNVNYAGKGLITEAVNVLTQYAFAELAAKRVEIRCSSENVKSAAIPLRLNYLLAATLKDHRVLPGNKNISNTHIFTRFDAENLPKREYTLV
ncbi:MAG TPA: GNAT family N-acetyltransferase [Parachlamydiaceae bacterium]|nr:GNAT family N-acetyltransferase [Parachlamydiaceae bacterium]